ncbi:MAG: putative Surface lipoprotein, partial [Rhodospirillales bacterium]|nr:putative Surface lipoprotein [Rhodospirillales bacterium]
MIDIFSNRNRLKPVAAAARLCGLGAFLVLAACAHAPSDQAEATGADGANDPAEPVNRVIFSGNQFLDRNLLKPVAQAYLDYIPDPAQHGI